jgi:hypothetical protein
MSSTKSDCIPIMSKDGTSNTLCQKCEIIKAYPKDTWYKITENITPLLKSDGLWWKEDKLVIPNDEKIKDKVLVLLQDCT